LTEPLLTVDDVRAAAARIADQVVRTPIVRSERLDELLGIEVLLKADNLQPMGAFKARGATNALRMMLEAGDAPRGVVAFSSGNHAQAVARAARAHGLPAVILMPEDAPPEKRTATEAYGAEVRAFDRAAHDRAEMAEAVVAETGYALIPPYDDVRVIAGQGTAALELFEDAGRLDALLVPVGGGGLIAGCAVVAEALAPACRVIGAEPEASGDTMRSLEAGAWLGEPAGATIADGQQAPQGRLTFEVMRGRVERAVTASDTDIAAAMRALFERAKLVAEPSGACGLAGLMRHAGALDLRGRRVGVVVSGGNVAPERFTAIVGSAN
jgi:threonine dehydratase